MSTLKDKNIEKNKMFNDKFQSFISKKATMTCMYPGCRKNAVNSHSISKKSSLYRIAEDGKLITSKSKRNDAERNKKIKFENIVINIASTFKGFCNDHESIFFDIDQREICTYRDIFCQIYRTTCKEIFINDAIKKTERDVQGFEILYNSKFEKSKLINSENVMHLFHDLLIDYPEAYQKIPLNKNFMAAFEPYTDASDLKIKVIIKKLNFKCPVAVQTKLTVNKGKLQYDCFVIVVPNDNSTIIIIISHPDELQCLLGHVGSDIDSLCFIESVMMLDGDWYIKPSIVQSWSPEKLKAIEDDYYFFTERKFIDSYDISIFDQIRQSLCKSLSNERRVAELKKINNFPNRKCFAKRESIQNEKMINDIYQKHK